MSLAEVHCVSTTKVHPASYIEKSEDGSSKRIDLNPWDLAFLRRPYMQRGLLFTKPQSIISKQEEEETNNNVMNNMISHLKTSLSNTLDHFYPLAGRLGIEKHEDDNKISVYINCNSEGAEFIHATADISIDNILSPIYTPQSIIDSFFTLHGVLNYEGQSHPLLSIQLHRRKGSLVVYPGATLSPIRSLFMVSAIPEHRLSNIGGKYQYFLREQFIM
ncbi:uncharacterized acetyltransferase At3g50280-like isoform X1 [Papaver somniferum]|uniref:uncharacterized acetyltransferase At3g50280-like isoform X1 n=1 Tax=Papaver somniferum TaxID=3469 RepID=UPI000E702CA2|nr:uncharacterized acetyltransferase At3g50280-like isoform X1 [Papaver somniferum]